MALKISSKKLEKLAGPKPAPQPVEKPPAPKPVARPERRSEPRPEKPDPSIALAVKAAEASAQAARDVQLTVSELKAALAHPHMPIPAQSPAVRMQVVRDKDGLIDYIDVIREGVH